MDRNEVTRLLNFVISEARVKDVADAKGQTVTIALRVVGNWIILGKDVGSAALIKNNPWISHEAWSYKSNRTIKLTNEHQEELKRLWRWIVSTPSVAVDDLLDRMKAWPIVTITEDEKRRLKGRDYIEPAERFRTPEGEIVVGKVTNGVWVART
ncbi:MAG TPA: hypothetical protein VGH40_21755 [Roseiarcus sp.]|jgi:hypothetical protein